MNPLAPGRGPIEVPDSAEFRRVRNLPRRFFTDQGDEALIEKWTRIFRASSGQDRLRAVQGRSCEDMSTVGGLFGPQRVGAGKTLTTLFAAELLGARAPLLVLPAALIEKTNREMVEYRRHWRVSTAIRMVSYETLGRVDAQNFLERNVPDVLICDEVHRIKNPKAAVTRRVKRYLEARPETKVVACSGTVMKDGLNDYAHILRWVLKDRAPLPNHAGELETWIKALDEIGLFSQVAPGPLVDLATDEDRAAVSQEGGGEHALARRGFGRRLRDTPGVVASSGRGFTGSLLIRGLKYEVAPATEKNFRQLRDYWETPDGWPMTMPTQAREAAYQLALGMHYEWRPRPPDAWLQPRKACAKFVRGVLSRSRTLDSEKQVIDAVGAGKLADAASSVASWLQVAPSFVPNPQPVWHDDAALRACEAWMKKGPGVVWVAHTFFARELSRRTGVPYYGENGLSESGGFIEDHPTTGGGASACVIASIKANATGRNLQRKWHRNLLTAMPSSGLTLEQLLGRTHREGQTADEVVVDVLIGCAEHVLSWETALAKAAMTRDVLDPQKVLLADKDMPTEVTILRWSGARWERNALSTAA